ncbi:MAG: hypothetical protein COA74_06500 [Gammaproteobacteria bacterium]|nr:MAG: hypothetical protein COA74_06500 [Gammaproteobacteria bacterium]
MIVFFVLFVVLMMLIIIPSQIFSHKKALQEVQSSLDVRLEQLKRDFQFRTKELARRLKSADLAEEEWQVLTLELEKDTRTSIDLTNIASQSSKTKVSGFFILLLVVLSIIVSGLSYKFSGNYDRVKTQSSLIKQLKNDSETIFKISSVVAKDPSQAHINDLYLALRSQVELKPQDVSTWRELALFNASYGRIAEAKETMKIALKIDSKDLDLQVVYAQLLTQSKESSDIILALKMVNQVLTDEPQHEGALLLLGMSYYQLGMYQKSILTLEKLLNLYGSGSNMANLINQRISSAKKLLMDNNTTNQASKPSAISNANLNVRVVIPDSIRARLKGDENIFIYAKAIEGPRFPVAVVKTTINALSDLVNLNDASAMQPQSALSKFDKIKITVRISFAGDVGAKKGDIQGSSEIIEAPFEGATIMVTVNEEIQ